MRKQTKIAAVVSAAALLAIGASMTSFAATGWQEENGTWVYYNKAGEMVTDSWEKSGDNWFYLDDSGEMATDSLIEDNDDYYYVNASGAMVRNQWVAIDNEDAGEDDQPDVWWYYFQGNGKAYKNTHSSGRLFKKVINGKTYCFDEDGKMQYGWVKKDDGTTNHDDNAFTDCEYYFGDENDGAMSVGWREIALTDVADADAEQPGDAFWDEDQVRWFFFKSSGQKQIDKTNKTINGKKYGFDQYGRMIADWHVATVEDANKDLKSEGYATDADSRKTYNYAREFQYFSSPESGARYTKGWFKVVPGYFLNFGDYDDGSSNWYYADGDGKIYAGQIKSIKGKKYAFDLKGGMISGLAILRTDGSNNILEYVDDEGNYDTEDNFDEYMRNHQDAGVYYFSDDADRDGSMKTGTQRVELDGERLTFKFNKEGTKKGQGVTGESNKKYYLGGKLMTAGSDNKVEILVTDGQDKYSQMTVAQFVAKYMDSKASNGTVYGRASKDSTVYKFKTGSKYHDYEAADVKNFVVINTAGSVVKSGTKKDGDGFKVVLKNDKIQQIFVD